jgi:hypothetical protein
VKPHEKCGLNYFYIGSIIGGLKHEDWRVNPVEGDGAMIDALWDKYQAGLGDNVFFAVNEEFNLSAKITGIIPVCASESDDFIEIMTVRYFNAYGFPAGQTPQYLASREQGAPGNDRILDPQEKRSIEDFALPGLIFHRFDGFRRLGRHPVFRNDVFPIFGFGHIFSSLTDSSATSPVLYNR